MNMADPEKKARSARKSALTRAINDIHQGVAEEDKDLVTEKLSTIKEKFQNFEAAHDAYHDKLEDEDAMEVSETYFADMHQKYIKVGKEAKQWLKRLDVKPEVPGQAASPSTAEMMKMLNLPRVELR
jgi:SpoVK/Ycf46/Vps4 family AAA+-type ATPase